MLSPVCDTRIHDSPSATLVVRLDKLPLTLVVISVVVAAITTLCLLLILLLLNVVSAVLNLLNLLLLLRFVLLLILVVWRAIDDLISLLLHAVGLLA